MPDPREITDVAIDCAIHGIAEPKNKWRNYIPPSDLGAMQSAGSGQITLQALVALLWFGNKADRAYAVKTLNYYADVCWSRFMLSEPWSSIYATAIVCCWVSTVLISEVIGEGALAQRFRGLIEAWAATCRLMEAKSGDKFYVIAAGCRCWGHEESISSMSGLWRYTSGRAEPPKPGSDKYGQPGAYDNWGWLDRAASKGIHILRGAASKYMGDITSKQLVDIAPRWAARTEMQLLGWADGSRLWIMGDDEAEMDDEDENGNTPGWEIAGILSGKIIALPEWPNPIDGLKRLRQVNCFADVDGSPSRGWTIYHSHLGQRVGKHPLSGNQMFVSSLPAYNKSKLIFHYLILAGNLAWVDMLSGQSTPEVPAEPTPDPVPVPNDPTSLKARIISLGDGRHLLLVKPSAGKVATVKKIHSDEVNQPGEDRYIIEENN